MFWGWECSIKICQKWDCHAPAGNKDVAIMPATDFLEKENHYSRLLKSNMGVITSQSLQTEKIKASTHKKTTNEQHENAKCSDPKLFTPAATLPLTKYRQRGRVSSHLRKVKPVPGTVLDVF